MATRTERITALLALTRLIDIAHRCRRSGNHAAAAALFACVRDLEPAIASHGPATANPNQPSKVMPDQPHATANSQAPAQNQSRHQAIKTRCTRGLPDLHDRPGNIAHPVVNPNHPRIDPMMAEKRASEAPPKND